MRRFNPDKRCLLGSELSTAMQLYVLSAYVHRYTGNHMPAWARKPRPCGTPYPVQFASDADWLANTLFMVNGTGKPVVGDCWSRPTWPRNPELAGRAA